MTESLQKAGARHTALLHTYLILDELIFNGEQDKIDLLLRYLTVLVPLLPASVAISALTIVKHSDARTPLYDAVRAFLVARDGAEVAADTLRGLEP